MVLRLGCFQFSVSPTPNKPHVSRMLKSCILDDRQELKVLGTLVCAKTQGVCDIWKADEIYLNVALNRSCAFVITTSASFANGFILACDVRSIPFANILSTYSK